MRRRMPRYDHVFGEQLSHLRHRLDDVARPWFRQWSRVDRRDRPRAAGRDPRARLEELHEIAFGHAAGDPTAVQGAQLDTVFGGHAADEGRGLRAKALLERIV